MTLKTTEQLIQHGTQISQIYKDDFNGFLIFILCILAAGVGMIFCGIAFVLYRTVKEDKEKAHQRELALSNQLGECRVVLTEVSQANTVLVATNAEFVKNNQELTNLITGLKNTLEVKFECVDKMEKNIVDIKLDIAALKATNTK